MKFALITEGASEHRIIKHIVSKYFKEFDPVINQIQPKIVNDTQLSGGGWTEVFKYCERPEIKDILIENDYLIIQIDTDQSQTSPFSVTHLNANGQTKTPTELHNDIKVRLLGLISEEIRNTYSDNIIFAICIHSIECWLLPVYYSDVHRTNVNNCLTTLNRELGKRNIHIITENNKNKPNGIRAYDTILKNFRKKKDITTYSQFNYGFKTFLGDLEKIPLDLTI
jgi:hypothetical protein